MENIILFSVSVFSSIIGIVILIYFIRKTKIDSAQNIAIKDLERHLTDIVEGQLKEVRGSVDGTSRDMRNQITSFTEETTHLEESLKQIQTRVKDISKFQDIFKQPKLRGQWGEASLEHILAQYFPSELYQRQYKFSSGEQVDAIIKLPNKRILPIDAKFPSDNFQKMLEANSQQEKDNYKKTFINDVKFKIGDIASKYIMPSQGTTDFALMYIPAEAIYYEIITNLDKESNISNFAWSKKIILTSPNTIYLVLKTIEHWFQDTQISKEAYAILKKLNKIKEDGEHLSEDFRKLGMHLSNADSAYGNSQKRLSLLNNKIEKLIDIRKEDKITKPQDSTSNDKLSPKPQIDNKDSSFNTQHSSKIQDSSLK